jgi:hypothetical protein
MNMRVNTILLALIAVTGLTITTGDAVRAQSMEGRTGPGMMQGGADQQTLDHGMMPSGRGPATAQR